jgi:hypothetical protein
VRIKENRAKPDLSLKTKLHTALTEERTEKPSPRLKLRKTKAAIALSQNASPSIFASCQTDSVLGLMRRNQASSAKSGLALYPPIHKNEGEIEFDGTTRELPIRNRGNINLNYPVESMFESVPRKLSAGQPQIRYVLSVPVDRRKSLSLEDYNDGEMVCNEER